MHRKRWTAAIVLGLLLAPAPGVFAAAESAHGCNGSVCACAHHTAPPAPAKSCHGAASAPRCGIRGSCQHEVPALATAPPYVLPAPVGLAMALSAPLTAPSLPRRTMPGHGRIDPPPPKAA